MEILSSRLPNLHLHQQLFCLMETTLLSGGGVCIVTRVWTLELELSGLQSYLASNKL